MGLPIFKEAPYLPENPQPQSFHWWSALWWNVRSLCAEVKKGLTLQAEQTEQAARITRLEDEVSALKAQVESLSRTKKGGK